MALPSNTDLATLDIAYLGAPFVGVGPGAAPPAGTRYILIT